MVNDEIFCNTYHVHIFYETKHVNTTKKCFNFLRISDIYNYSVVQATYSQYPRIMANVPCTLLVKSLNEVDLPQEMLYVICKQLFR